MATTIHALLGYEGNESKLQDIAEFINNLFDLEFTSKKIEEEGNVYMYNANLTIDEIQVWSEMEEYALANEIYLHVYDHTSKSIKSFYYDEDEVWIDNDDMGGEEYEAILNKL